MSSSTGLGLGVLALGAVVIVGGVMFVGPTYNVWSQQKAGEAILARSNSEKQIRLSEAKAKEEAAALEARAEITKAEGTARANELLSKSLSPQVLQYLWIRAQEENGSAGDRTIVYIPTNPSTGLPVGLPITESQRLNQSQPQAQPK